MDRPNAVRPALTARIETIFHFFLFLASTICFFPTSGHTGPWQVSPAMITLSQEAKSSVITITNEGEEKIYLQVKAVEWSQDPEGKDVFRDTNDLIFFPRILVINKDEQKILRVGTKISVAPSEKSYRLFIEEIPQPKKAGTEANQLTIAVRFGVPVFVKPLKEELGAELVTAQMTSGRVTATIKNTGNSHFKISDIILTGRNEAEKETFSSKRNGWYLLPGASRVYSIPIPAGKCAQTKWLNLAITTDTKIKLDRRLNAEKGMCVP